MNASLVATAGAKEEYGILRGYLPSPDHDAMDKTMLYSRCTIKQGRTQGIR